MKMLRSVCENCNFFSLRPADESQISDFITKLTAQIDIYEKQEAIYLYNSMNTNQLADFNESELDTASEDDEKSTV